MVRPSAIHFAAHLLNQVAVFGVDAWPPRLAGVPKGIVADLAHVLNIQGMATHNRTLSITARDLTNLKNKIGVTGTSSTDLGHSHAVTFTPM
jgi:hypothetical protein